MSKLSAIREMMTKRNIPTLAMESDQVAAARRIVGNANSAEPYLSNMIRALQLMPWRNTATDWQRLEAAVIVRAYRGAHRIT
jgi:hypothetical protein